MVGIDPGKDTGVAIYDQKSGRLVSLKAVAFWDAIKMLNRIANGREKNTNGTVKGAALVIENPNLNKPVFPHKMEQADFNRSINNMDHDLHEKTLRVFAKRAQNVGQNKQMATFLIEYAERIGFRVSQVRPGKKKVNAETFNSRTGWKGKSNQHSRDAALLLMPVV